MPLLSLFSLTILTNCKVWYLCVAFGISDTIIVRHYYYYYYYYSFLFVHIFITITIRVCTLISLTSAATNSIWLRPSTGLILASETSDVESSFQLDAIALSVDELSDMVLPIAEWMSRDDSTTWSERSASTAVDATFNCPSKLRMNGRQKSSPGGANSLEEMFCLQRNAILLLLCL